MHPVDRLPNELLLNIFQYLNGKDLITCTLVNERWNYVITSDQYLWFPIYEKEMNNHLLWLNRDIINLLNSYNLLNEQPTQVSVDEAEENNPDRQQKKYRTFIDFITELLDNPACLMKHLYEYYNEQETLQQQQQQQTSIIPPFSKLNIEPICLNCILFGPAIDTVHLSSGLLQTILNWIDLSVILNRPTVKVNAKQMSTFWAGKGFLLRLPTTCEDSNQSSILLNTTILHSRKHMERMRYSYGGSRLFDSLLIESANAVDTAGEQVNLTQNAMNSISTSEIVFYAIDIRKEDSRVAPNLDDPIELINPYHSEIERWNEIRLELNALTHCMNSEQILLILGIGDQSNKENNYNLIEIASNLGCGYPTTIEVDDNNTSGGGTSYHANTIRPLDKPGLNWKLWCTASNGSVYTNLEEIFHGQL
uniref:F-box domain-containing protein n=1 Tax=Trichobilharzia regenti TaxID=157069 RepID=A0AA85KKP1_TRIRE|nr:unnamed protein product [Trichobilharzia regenti]